MREGENDGHEEKPDPCIHHQKQPLLGMHIQPPFTHTHTRAHVHADTSIHIHTSQQEQRNAYKPVIVKHQKSSLRLAKRRVLALLVSEELEHGADCPHGYGPFVGNQLDTSLSGPLKDRLQGNGHSPADGSIHPDEVLRLVDQSLGQHRPLS